MLSIATEQRIAERFAERYRELHQTLLEVDQGVEAMTTLIRHIGSSRVTKQRNLLEDLEGASFATALLLPRILSWDNIVSPKPTFDVKATLVAAVGQYLPYLLLKPAVAIRAGASLAFQYSANLTSHDNLSSQQLDYLVWATPRLLRHLIYSLPDESDSMLNRVGYSPFH
jgi:hypothetical protein